MPEDILNKKKWIATLKFFAAYLVAAFTFIQFLQFILDLYGISYHWVKLTLWFFVGIIPSLIIYFNHKERINNFQLKLREKIIFPVNIVLLTVVLFFVFGNKNLGATTKTIKYQDEQGKQQTALITKEEFRKGFYVFPFKPKDLDSSKAWLQYGINYLTYQDLLQNKNLTPVLSHSQNTADKVREASYFYDYYVDGEFEMIDSTYTLTTFIRDSKSAEIIKQETFKGPDVLELIDDVTVFVTNNFTSKEFNAPKYLDLDVKEFTSKSIKAIEYFMRRDYTKAVKEDNTFALAYLLDAKSNLNFNQSKYEERQLADNAYKYRSKLPLQKQGEALILKNLAYDEFENAEQLVKLQLEVNPSDDMYNRILYGIYGRTKNLKAYTQRAYNAYSNNKNVNNGYNAIEAGLILKNYDYIIKQTDLVALSQPNDEYVFYNKLRPLLHKGANEEALKIQDKFKLLHPDYGNLTKVYDTAIVYLKHNKSSVDKLKKFVGTYRSNYNEQTYTYWVENNTLLQYVSNQIVFVYLLAGDNKIVSENPIQGRTWLKEFIADSTGNFYATKMEQNDPKNTSISWHWKIDETIAKAEALFETKELDSAKIAYENAINVNPKHYFLKDVLAHINYVKSIDTETLQNQLEDVVGSYGPREFWLDDGRLFYKRKQTETGEVFLKIELLPISNDRYINTTKIGDHHAFKLKDGKAISSFAYNYDIENEKWVVLDNDRNLFNKD